MYMTYLGIFYQKYDMLIVFRANIFRTIHLKVNTTIQNFFRTASLMLKKSMTFFVYIYIFPGDQY